MTRAWRPSLPPCARRCGQPAHLPRLPILARRVGGDRAPTHAAAWRRFTDCADLAGARSAANPGPSPAFVDPRAPARARRRRRGGCSVRGRGGLRARRLAPAAARASSTRLDADPDVAVADAAAMEHVLATAGVTLEQRHRGADRDVAGDDHGLARQSRHAGRARHHRARRRPPGRRESRAGPGGGDRRRVRRRSGRSGTVRPV